MAGRADAHDLDKLRRWQRDLEDTPVAAPPVYAVFLVSGADKAAHDVFRSFRARFEECKLGFAHLVIFGQHGSSTTQRQLRNQLGVAAEAGPTLALFCGGDTAPQLVSLPEGAGDSDLMESRPSWEDALEWVMPAAAAAGSMPDSTVLREVKRVCDSVLELART